MRAPLAATAFRFADKDIEPVGDGIQKGLHFLLCPFRLELDPPVGQVADKPADLEFAGNLQGTVTESNPLDASAKKGAAVIYLIQLHITPQ